MGNFVLSPCLSFLPLSLCSLFPIFSRFGGVFLLLLTTDYKNEEYQSCCEEEGDVPLHICWPCQARKTRTGFRKAKNLLLIS